MNNASAKSMNYEILFRVFRGFYFVVCNVP